MDDNYNDLIANITEFVILTQASEGDALKYLTKNKGDLGKAIDAYFQAAGRREDTEQKPESKLGKPPTSTKQETQEMDEDDEEEHPSLVGELRPRTEFSNEEDVDEDEKASSFEWTIKDFPSQGPFLISDSFVSPFHQGITWHLMLRVEKHLSISLCSAARRAYNRDVSFKMTIANKQGGDDIIRSGNHRFSPKVVRAGFPRIASLSKLSSDGFLVDNTLVIQLQLLPRPAQLSLVPLSLRDVAVTEYVGLLGTVSKTQLCSIPGLIQMLFILHPLKKAMFSMDYASLPRTSYGSLFQYLFFNLLYKGPAIPLQDLEAVIKNEPGWRQLFSERDPLELYELISSKLELHLIATEYAGVFEALFGGKLHNFIRCTHVDYESTRTDGFTVLALPLEGMHSLYDSLNAFIATETLDGSNRYSTPSHGLQDAVKGSLIQSPPPALLLSLNCFIPDYRSGQLKKATRPSEGFKYPTRLSLDPYVVPSSERTEPCTYQLHAVLVHAGSMTDGHHYAFIRPTTSPQWYLFNEGKVNKVTERIALGRSLFAEHRTLMPYMLLYIREDQEELLVPEHFNVADIVPEPSHTTLLAEFNEQKLQQEIIAERNSFIDVLVVGSLSAMNWQGWDLSSRAGCKRVYDRTSLSKAHPLYPRGLEKPLSLKVICVQALISRAARKANEKYTNLLTLPDIMEMGEEEEEEEEKVEAKPSPTKRAPPPLVADIEAEAAHAAKNSGLPKALQDSAALNLADDASPLKEPPMLPAVMYGYQRYPLGVVDDMLERDEEHMAALPHDLVTFMRDRSWLPRVPLFLRIERSTTLRDFKRLLSEIVGVPEYRQRLWVLALRRNATSRPDYAILPRDMDLPLSRFIKAYVKDPMIKFFLEESQLPLEKEPEMEKKIQRERRRLAKVVKAGAEVKATVKNVMTEIRSFYVKEDKEDPANEKSEEKVVQDARKDAMMLLESSMQDEFFTPLLANYILIFFKYYDPDLPSLRPVGYMFVDERATIQSVVPYLNSVCGFSQSTELMLFEEIKPTMIDPISEGLTFKLAELGYGDILIFQKAVRGPCPPEIQAPAYYQRILREMRVVFKPLHLLPAEAREGIMQDSEGYLHSKYERVKLNIELEIPSLETLFAALASKLQVSAKSLRIFQLLPQDENVVVNNLNEHTTRGNSNRRLECLREGAFQSLHYCVVEIPMVLQQQPQQAGGGVGGDKATAKKLKLSDYVHVVNHVLGRNCTEKIKLWYKLVE